MLCYLINMIVKSQILSLSPDSLLSHLKSTALNIFIVLKNKNIIFFQWLF